MPARFTKAIAGGKGVRGAERVARAERSFLFYAFYAPYVRPRVLLFFRVIILSQFVH